MHFPVHLLVIVSSAILPLTTSYPTYVHSQRKADPFVALANTLRQQEQAEQQQQQQQQQFQQHQQLRLPVLDNGYYYDYGREGPSDDDLYQMEQFQRQLSRAAVAPFFGRAQRSSWGNVVMDDPEYGIPVQQEPGLTSDVMMDQQDMPSEWYDTAVDPEEVVEEEREQEQRKQEGQLLLDMLTEYMLLYGSGGQPEEGVQEESKRTVTAPLANNNNNNNRSQAADYKDNATTPESTSGHQTATADHIKEKQPPVRKSQDGKSLGQEEFPMMRPATPQKQQWMTSNQLLPNGHKRPTKSAEQNTKRHYKNKNSAIVTSDDELIEELDNLKMKKN